MLKRLTFLCAALLAVSACSHNGSDNGTAPQPAPAQTSAPAAPVSPAPAASTPAAASTAAASSSTAAAPAAASTTAEQQKPSAPAAPFVDDGKWVEGKNYFTIEPAQPTSNPDKIVVT